MSQKEGIIGEGLVHSMYSFKIFNSIEDKKRNGWMNS